MQSKNPLTFDTGLHKISKTQKKIYKILTTVFVFTNTHNLDISLYFAVV